MEELYNQLYNDGKYTKTFEDFKVQFGNHEKSEKLYTALNEAGDYTKSFDEFKIQFSIPAKIQDSASADPTVESVEDTGSKSEKSLSAWQSIKNTFKKAGERLYDVVEFWGADEGAGSGLDIATNSFYSLLSSQEAVDEYVKNNPGWLSEGLGSESTIEAIKKYKEEQEESNFATKGIVASAKEGDIGGLIAGSIEGLVNAFSSGVYFLGTLGTGVFSEVAAENYITYNEQKAKNLGVSLDELIRSGEADNLAPVGLGAVSVGLERVGFGKVLKATAGKNIIKNTSAKLIYNRKARNVANILAAGGTEFTTEILQHATDKINEEFGRTAGTEEDAKFLQATFDAIFSEEGLEAGLQGLIGGGGMASVGTSYRAMNTIRTTVDGDLITKNIDDLSKLRVKFNKATDKTEKAGIQKLIDTKESEIADSVRKGNDIYNSLSEGQLKEIENLTDLADAAAYQITELNKKFRAGEIDKTGYDLAVEGFKSEYDGVRQQLIDMNLKQNIKTAENISKEKGLDLDVMTTAEVDALMNSDKVSEKNRKTYFDNKSKGYEISAFVIGNKIVIDKDIARKTGSINAGMHEVLHPVFNKLIGNAKQQGKMVRQFRRAMTSSQRRFVDAEMKKRGYTGKNYNTEYVNVFSDALRKKQINYDKTTFEKIGDAVVSIFKPVGYTNIGFESGKDVYNFIKEFDQSAEQGKLTTKAAEALKDVDLSDAGLQDELQASKSLSPEQTTEVTNDIATIKQLAEENAAIAARFGKEPIKGGKQARLEQKVLTSLKPVIDKVITNRTKALYDPIPMDAKKSVSRQDFQDSMRSDIETMVLSEYNGTQDIEKFLVNRAYLRANDLAKRLGIEEKINVSLDALSPEGKETIQVADTYDYGSTLTEIRSENARQAKLINPLRIFNKKLAEEYNTAVEEAINNMLPERLAELSFAGITDLAPEVTAKFWGTTVKKVVNAAANLATKEIPPMQALIYKNIDTFIKLLPEGAILEGTAARESLIGTGLGVPRKLQQAFYDKKERTTKGAGLIPFELKKNITKKDFAEAFGINEDGTFEKFGGKDPRAQTILALIRLYGKITSNTAIRQLANLTEQQKLDIKAGAAEIQFSKEVRKAFGLKSSEMNYKDPKQIEYARSGLVKVFKKLKEKGYNSGEVANIFIGTARGSWGTLGNKYIPGKDNKLVEIVYDKITGKKRYNKFLMTGAKDFFSLLNEAFTDVIYERGASKIIDRKNVYSLDKVPSQSPKGFISGKMFKGSSVTSSTISERKIYAEKQRNNLRILVEVLKELHDSKVLTGNQTAMILGTLGSSTNGLIRTAAKLIGYSKQGLKGKLTDEMFRYEHSQPASITISELAKLITDKNYPYSFDELMKGFNVYIIPKKYDKVINALYSSKSPLDKNGNLILSDENKIARYSSPDVKKAIKKAGLPPLKIMQLSKSIDNATDTKLNKDFNKIIENATTISSKKTISEAKSKMLAKKKGSWKFFVPPSAEDFSGLMYKLLGKGEVGNKNSKWFKENLFDPYAQGIRDFESYKQQTIQSFRKLKKSIKKIPKGLNKTNETGFTNDVAVRVYLWNKKGYEIPGLDKNDTKELVDLVNNNEDLKNFAEQINALMTGYAEPDKNWLSGTVTTDIIGMINSSKREEFLQQWQENADAIFTKDNINKLRAAFGEDYVEALKDMLYRMKSGRNRPSGSNKLTNQFMNWVNDSVGTIMFFNTRSALLQTLSISNFINWGDNNPIKAAKAFSNQKQFWSDFAMIFNSDFLKQRRSGLKTDVNADDIASAAETSTNKAKAALSSILKMGFLPTQIADSFAIAMGGASFYRNRVDSYIKEGLSQKEAESKAFLDFQEVAEETQQSSRPDRISQQQASPLGRIILAFANTPMQYMRLTKKAILDLKNKRGDVKTNVSKIIYYTAVQNIIFSSLQSALFAALFDDDDEELIDDKKSRIANSMLDTLLRGMGVGGAVVSTIKNINLEIDKQSKKPRPDYTQAAIRSIDLSPPISSKLRKLMSAGRAFSYKNVRSKMKGYSLENPAFYAVGQIVSATTNIPLDRAIKKADNIRLAIDNDTKLWQKIALALGYSSWDVGIVDKDKNKGKKGFGKTTKWKNTVWKKDKWKNK